MPLRLIEQDRIAKLNDNDSAEGHFVLYWMQQSQRAEQNHALEFAIQRANALSTRLVVLFALTESYPEANLRHFRFMLEGLQEVEASLRQRGIRLIIRLGDPAKVAASLAKRASEVVCDRGYLRHQVQWRNQIAQSAACRVWRVEADAIVPVERATSKAEYAARTLRPKLHGLFNDYLTELATTPIATDSLNPDVRGIDLSDLDAVLDRMSIDRGVQPSAEFSGGTTPAKQRLKAFRKNSLSNYDSRTSVIDSNASLLSPYLHFGQISPVAVAREINSSRGHQVDVKQAFIEELLVRRELAINFVHYHSDYDSLNCLPDWAKETLEKHQSDDREFHYTATELEEGRTHDPAWNAAMMEMKHRGYLHNHLRMYWGKKIIEWTNTTWHAYRTVLKLNNRYFLDGRDANSFANVLWLFGMHDRAHQERKIFGKVRYMSAGGLERKIDVGQYIHHVAERFDVRIHGVSTADA